MYLAIGTRPDDDTSLVARSMDSPIRADWTNIKRIFKYLKGTIELGIMYTGVCKPLSRCGRTQLRILLEIKLLEFYDRIYLHIVYNYMKRQENSVGSLRNRQSLIRLKTDEQLMSCTPKFSLLMRRRQAGNGPQG